MIQGLILALQFFTRIPINIPVDFNRKNIRYSIFFLPLVGALIGGLGGLVFFVVQPYNLLVAGFLALLTTIVITGGLHIDGLSDTADGFLSNRDQKRTLEIMKDSRIGAFGVLSIVLLVLFKFIMMISIEELPLAMVLSFVNSRLVVSGMIAYKKTTSQEGLGKMFHESNPKTLTLISLVAYLVILIFVDIRYLIPLGLTFLVGQYISHLSYQKIEGLTGDVYGAMIEVGDGISLLGFWGVMVWISS